MNDDEHAINNKISVMIENLKSDDSRIVSESIKTLGALGGSRELEALLSVITSSEYLVHHANAINQIHNITAPRESAIAPLIYCAVWGAWPEIRSEAYGVISSIGGKEAFEALKGVLFTEGSVSAILNLRESRGTYRDSLVEIFLSNIRNPIMAEGAIHQYDQDKYKLPFSTLESIETKQDYISAKLFWERDYEIRDDACWAMRQLGENKKLVAECYTLLQNQNASIRHSSTYCLGHVISDARTVKKLEGIWREDDNQIVRNCAVYSLVKIANGWNEGSGFDSPAWASHRPATLETPEEIRWMAVRTILNLERIDVHWPRFLSQFSLDEKTKIEVEKFLATNWSGKKSKPMFTPKKRDERKEKIPCDVCDTDNYAFMSSCSECGTRLRKAVARSGIKKKNKKKNESKIKRKILTQCRGNKQIYPTKKDAENASRGIFKNTGRMSKIYRCGTCKGYHLTKLRSK